MAQSAGLSLAPAWAFDHALAFVRGEGPLLPEACEPEERDAILHAHREMGACWERLAREDNRDRRDRVAAAPDAAHRYMERVRYPNVADHLGYAAFLHANAGHVLRLVAGSVRTTAHGRYEVRSFAAHPDGLVFLSWPAATWTAGNVRATRDLHPWACAGRHLGHLIAFAWDCDITDGILAAVGTIAERCTIQ